MFIAISSIKGSANSETAARLKNQTKQPWALWIRDTREKLATQQFLFAHQARMSTKKTQAKEFISTQVRSKM